MLSKQAQSLLVNALQQAKLKTSATIHVHFCHRTKKAPVVAATQFFKHIKLDKSKNKNTVLIYILEQNRQFVIMGDIAADALLPKDFWTQCQVLLAGYFKKDQHSEGLEAVIKKISDALAPYFPAG